MANTDFSLATSGMAKALLRRMRSSIMGPWIWPSAAGAALISIQNTSPQLAVVASERICLSRETAAQ
ncbi:hypothetical protein D3C71_1903960 [compost metagenome]